VILAGGVSLAVLAGPGRGLAPAPAGESQAKKIFPAATQAALMPSVRDHVERRDRLAESKYRVVASSVLARGVRFERITRRDPPQRISVIAVGARARIRAVHVRAGPAWAPFATVSSAAKRMGALAGINGIGHPPPGHPMLVREARIVAPYDGRPSLERHPRTGIGLTRDGSTLFVTVDGRRTTAVGMTLRGFAAFMRALGAVWAVNLDGGASTTMVIRGKIANSPSDPYGERLVPYAVVLSSGPPGASHLFNQLHELDHRIVPPPLEVRGYPQDFHGVR
jgi:hypothetical protein